MAGTVYGLLENPKLTYSSTVKLRAGINKISLLSVAVGLPVSPYLLIKVYILGMLMTVMESF